MYDDITVTRIAREHDFDESQMYKIYEHMQTNHLLGCVLEMCANAVNPHESLDKLVNSLDAGRVNKKQLREFYDNQHYPEPQEPGYEEPKNLLDCDGEVDDTLDYRRIDWYNQISGNQD